MRTEFQITQDLNAAKADYHKKAKSMTSAEQEKATAKIVALNNELNSCLIKGAKKLPGKDDLVGRRIERRTSDGRPVYFEIGQGDKRTVGTTQEEAVYNWNNKIYFTKKDSFFYPAK